MLMLDPEKFKKKFGHDMFSTEPASAPLSYRHRCKGKWLILPRWAPNLLEKMEEAPWPWKILDERSLALEFCPVCGKTLSDDELESEV